MFILFLPAAQADVPTVSKFSYSDDLNAGDKFAWEVSSTYSLQDPLFKDGSVITLEVLKDLAGVEFSGDLESNELTNYFSLDFGNSAFVSGEEAISVVVFPDSITLGNGTTLDPLKGFWVEVLIDQVDVSDGVVESTSVSQVGDILTVEATITYTIFGQPVESNILAKINTLLGITEEYNLDLKTSGGTQSLDVVRVEVTDDTATSTPVNNDTSEEDDESALPLSLYWMLAPILMMPILKKYR